MSVYDRDNDVDDLDLHLREKLEDPEFARAYEDASIRSSLLRAYIKVRKNLGLTQSDVAHRMNTTQSAVSEFESAATDPRLSTLQRYARAVNCRLDVQLCTVAPSRWAAAHTAIYASRDYVLRVMQPQLAEVLDSRPPHAYTQTGVHFGQSHHVDDEWAEKMAAVS